jgi:hypothetical protein
VKALLAATPLVALLVLLAACGDDADEPGSDNPGGPAAGVEGVWEGTYQSNATDRSGTYCLVVDQAGRDLSGSISFDGDDAVPVGGLVANGDISFAWGPQLADSPAVVDDNSISRGGTLTGQVDGGTMSGSWAATVGDIGSWSGEHTGAEDCG